MKIQWSFILALLFALIVAIFAVINVDSVLVDYLFGTTEIPLILIILGAALLGGVIVGSIGLIKYFKLKRQLKLLTKEKIQLEKTIKKITENKETKTIDNKEQSTKLLTDKQKEDTNVQ